MKVKVLSFIDNDLYFRNFVLSGAFNEASKNYNFKLCLSDAVAKLKKFTPKRFTALEYVRNERNRNRIKVFNQISMRHFSKKSSTFAIKTNQYKAGFKDDLFFRFFALSFAYDFAKQYLLKKFIINRTLEKIIKNEKPKIVLFPTSGYEATGYELILLSKKYKFKTFFLTNGWDNLSSKGIFLLKPDYLGVWGPQALVDAVNIQGMQPHQCFLLGCSRYEDYFKKSTGIKKIFPFKYILFAGSTTAADEITPLKICDDVISKIKMNIKIVYRPHPMRAKRIGYDFFDAKEYKNVIIDPQVADDYFEDKISGAESGAAQNFPDLKYYPSLLNHSLFIVSPLSSIIMEAAIFNVPSLVLTHKDGNPIPASLQARWKHFDGAETVPGWFFGDNLNHIRNQFKMMLLKFKDESSNNRSYKGILSIAIKKYLFYDKRLYSDRLYEALREITYQ